VAGSVSPFQGDLLVVDEVPSAFAKLLLEAYEGRGGSRFSLVLSGGPTARACYERVAEAEVGRIDWSVVDVLMGDERCVPADDPDANQRMVRETLLDRVEDIGSFQPMSCAQGPEAYQRVVERFPAFDLMHLGVGPDGHTASLFEGSSALDAPDTVLVARNHDPSEANPYDRMTLTLAAISRARLVVFTVDGESKRQVMTRLRSGEDVPAARVRAQEVVWLVDPAAAMP
jgi:6-phosphogluconolactonase